MAIVNPFAPTFGATPPMLAGRDELLKDIASAMATGPTHPAYTSLLLGLRGAGKTVMLAELRDLAQSEGWISISADAATHGLLNRIAHEAMEHLNRMARDLARPITRDLSAAGIRMTRAYDRAADLSRSVANVLEALGRHLRHHNVGLLLTVDELHAGERDELRRLGVAVQDVTRIGQDPMLFAGAGLQTLEETLLSDNSVTFLQRCARYDIGFLSWTEAWSAIDLPVRQHGGRMTSEAIKSAVTASQGYPFMVQLVGYYAWEAADDPMSVITARDVASGSEIATHMMGQLVVAPLWNGLSQVGQRFAVAMAQDEGPSRMANIAARLGVSSGYASVYRQRLMRTGLIAQAGRGQITFAFESARAWIRELDDYEWLVESLRSRPIGFSKTEAETS